MVHILEDTIDYGSHDSFDDDVIDDMRTVNENLKSYIALYKKLHSELIMVTWFTEKV